MNCVAYNATYRVTVQHGPSSSAVSPVDTPQLHNELPYFLSANASTDVFYGYLSLTGLADALAIAIQGTV